MASRLIKEKEQIKLQDKFMQLERENGELKLKLTPDVDTSLVQLDDIVDSHGRKRFIEGTPTSPTIEGVTITYKKWSLSGTHLMLVLAGSVENGVTLPVWQILCNAPLPSWVADKVNPVLSTTVEWKTIILRNADYTNTNLNVQLVKVDNALLIQITNGIVTTSAGNFRLEFDLLIDSE